MMLGFSRIIVFIELAVTGVCWMLWMIILLSLLVEGGRRADLVNTVYQGHLPPRFSTFCEVILELLPCTVRHLFLMRWILHVNSFLLIHMSLMVMNTLDKMLRVVVLMVRRTVVDVLLRVVIRSCGVLERRHMFGSR